MLYLSPPDESKQLFFYLWVGTLAATALTAVFALHVRALIIALIVMSVAGLVVSMMELEKDARNFSSWRLGQNDTIDLDNTQVAISTLNSVTRNLTSIYGIIQ